MFTTHFLTLAHHNIRLTGPSAPLDGLQIYAWVVMREPVFAYKKHLPLIAGRLFGMNGKDKAVMNKKADSQRFNALISLLLFV